MKVYDLYIFGRNGLFERSRIDNIMETNRNDKFHKYLCCNDDFVKNIRNYSNLFRDTDSFWYKKRNDN